MKAKLVYLVCQSIMCVVTQRQCKPDPPYPALRRRYPQRTSRWIDDIHDDPPFLHDANLTAGRPKEEWHYDSLKHSSKPDLGAGLYIQICRKGGANFPM